MAAPKFTKMRRDMLARIVRVGPILERALTGSGGASVTALRDLRALGYVKRVSHPTVTEGLNKWPADAIEATEDGRIALAAPPPKGRPHA